MVCIYYLTVLLILNLRFESTVKTKGYQTQENCTLMLNVFENTVDSYDFQDIPQKIM